MCRAWLYKILLFTYSAQNRKRARQPFLVDLDAAGETALLVDAPTPDTLAAEAVKAAFDRLPENFRTLVVLVDVEGLTYRVDAAAYDHSAEDHIACALSYPDGMATRFARRRTSSHRSSTSSTPSVFRTALRDRRAHVPHRAATTHTSSFAATADTVALRRARRARGVAGTPTTVLAGDTLDVHATTRLDIDFGGGDARPPALSRRRTADRRPTSRRTSCVRQCVSFAVSRTKLTGGQPCWIAQGLDSNLSALRNRAMCSPARNASA